MVKIGKTEGDFSSAKEFSFHTLPPFDAIKTRFWQIKARAR
jgi:hypothetical protein